jgi:RNA polymerase subunit RPABC4/transcription elongation factor Spt4
MLIATFGPSTGWVGKKIVYEGDVFILEDYGRISAGNVMEYDGHGHLVWAMDGTRAWVGSLATRVPPEASAAVRGEDTGVIRCASCGSEVNEQSRECPNCGADPSVANPTRGQDPAAEQPPTLLACPACQHQVSSQASLCPNCSHPISPTSRTPPSGAPDTAAAAASPRTPVDEIASRASGGAWFALVGGILIVAGSLLPWLQVHLPLTTVSRNGMQLGNNYGFSVDGLVTLVLGLITCLIGLSMLLRFQMPPFVQRSSIVTGVVVGALVLLNIPGLQNYVKSVGAGASIGYGLWVVLTGCALAIVGGLVLRATRQASL